MIRLAQFSIRRPRAVLATCLSIAAVLTLIGLGVSHSLSPSVVVVPGTESSRAQQLANQRFGPTDLVPILLQGPAAQLNRQGPILVRDLVKRPHTRALSAWDAGAASTSLGLRPSQTAAMIVVSVDKAHKDVVNTDQAQIERIVARDISAPVRANVTGQPSIDRALKTDSLHDTRMALLIAIPVLFLLLLLGLRAPIAAAVVTAMGVGVAFSSFGLMTVLGKITDVDPLAVATGTMSALVMGVAFSLLILDRYHQQRHAAADGEVPDVAAATAAAVSTAGKAILIIGAGLVGAKLLASAFGVSKVLTSLGIGAVTCELMATGAAVVVMPATISLLGDRLELWSFAAPGPLARAWQRLVDGGSWVTRHAVGVGAAATALLLALAIPALSMNTGPPGVGQLPKHDRARLAFEQVARVMGPGWPTPYSIVVAAKSGPITTPAMLASLDRFQAQIAADKRVVLVSGPGTIYTATQPLKKLSPSLDQSAALVKGSKKSLLELQAGLGLAGNGAQQLQNGLSTAASGAGQLNTGSGAAQSGSAQLHAGLAAAHSGSSQLSAGLDQALAGATALQKGAAQALAGSGQLSAGLGKASGAVNGGQNAFGLLAKDAKSTDSQLNDLKGQAASTSSAVNSALDELHSMTVGKTDPSYDPTNSALQHAQSDASAVTAGVDSASSSANATSFLASGVATQGAQLATGLNQLRAGSVALTSGISKLKSGNAQLASGIDQLSGGGGQLTSGLTKLESGAGQLEAGLGQLTTGTGQLQSGLAGGVDPAGQLVNGLGVMQSGVAKFRGQLPSTKDLAQLRQQAPGLFNSGYFMLAAVQGAQPADANAATFTINVAQGGSAAQMLIVPKYPLTDGRTAALGDRLTTLTRAFAAKNRAVAAVGGPAGNYANYTSSSNSKFPLVIIGVCLGLALLLGIALRAVLVPMVAMLFALLTVAAGYGIMQLLFGGSNPPLGGPGYLDPVSLTEVFIAEIGIPLIFTIVLLSRVREDFVNTGNLREGLTQAMRQTAPAATGMGLLMVAGIIPFAATQVLPVREIGVAVAIVIAIDVLIVRPVLLPAAIAVLGRRGWWPTHSEIEPKADRAKAAPKPHRRFGRHPRPAH